jgi:hypothetical protein
MSPLRPHVSPTSLFSLCPVGPYVPYIHIRDIRDMNNLIVRARERDSEKFEALPQIRPTSAAKGICTAARTPQIQGLA